MSDRQLIADLLSALEYHTEQTRPIEFSKVAIEAAREYLSKPAQQQEPRKPQQRSTEHPVAYAVYHRMGGGKSLHWSEQHSEDGDHNEYQLVPLYTSPPAQRKPLPDFSPIFSGIKEQ